MIDEYVIVACLNDDEWRSPPQIKRLSGQHGDPAIFTEILRKMAKAGKIDRKTTKTTVPRARSGCIAIEFYRKVS